MKRYWPQKFHVFVAAGIFLAIVTLLYLIVTHHNQRIDLTRDKIYSVSKETLQVLKRMEEGEIRIRAFFAEEDPARRDLLILLKEMATHHPRFRYAFFDPDRSPSEARRFAVDSYQTVVVEYQKRVEQIKDSSEEGLTNAFIRLAHPQKQTICFTKGHGENGLKDEERTGFSQFKQVLEGHAYGIKEVQTLTAIPQDCSILVMGGPRYELLPKEIEILQNFPREGKGLLLLIDPMDPGAGKSFRELAKSFGLTLAEDVVVDKVSRMFGGDYLIPMVAQFLPHPITQRFHAALFFPVARTVRKSSEVSDDLKVTELARTTPGSWAETNLKKLEKGDADLDPATDLVGPVSLAAAVEPVKGKWRMVVVGDSDFLTNAHLRMAGNQDFALNVLEWLVKDDRWISIRAKQTRFEPLFLRINQSVGAASFAVGVLPFTLLVTGSVGIWIRRKKSV